MSNKVRSTLLVLLVLLALDDLRRVVMTEIVMWQECAVVCSPRRAEKSGTYACYCAGWKRGGWVFRGRGVQTRGEEP